MYTHKKNAFVLALIIALGVVVRCVPIWRFGPTTVAKMVSYRNVRATEYVFSEGLYSFFSWYDDRSWYPHGIPGKTEAELGPVLAASAFARLGYALNMTLDLHGVIAFVAPVFTAFTLLFVYQLGCLTKDENSGLAAAFLFALIPGHAAQSMSGAFDGDAIAICIVVLTFANYMRAMQHGSRFWAASAAFMYFATALTWQQHYIVQHIVAMHASVLVVLGLYDSATHVVYSTFFIFSAGLILVTGSSNSSILEGLRVAIIVFSGIQLLVYSGVVEGVSISAEPQQIAPIWRKLLITSIGLLELLAVCGSSSLGISVANLSFIMDDPSTGIEFHSSAENQPSSWASFYYDLNLLMILIPFGWLFCVRQATREHLFMAVCTSVCCIHSGMTVKMMSAFAVPASVLSGVTVASIVGRQWGNLSNAKEKKKLNSKKKLDESSIGFYVSCIVLATLAILVMLFTYHSVWLISSAHSTPNMIQTATNSDGSIYVFDDFRESCKWMREHTPENSTIASWWDYGSLISHLGNRTVLSDSISGNPKQLADIGRAFASSEHEGHAILRRLGATYVFIVFGGYAGHASDDLNKFTWMLRIAASNGDIRESDYYSALGSFRVDRGATEATKSSLLYKLSYYRFGDVYTNPGEPGGFDRVRKSEIGVKDIRLETMQEVYTSKHWLVRIYKVEEESNRGFIGI